MITELDSHQSEPAVPRLAILTLCCGLVACDMSHTASGDVPSASSTIGLVLSGFDPLFYVPEDGKGHCPDGLVHSSKENWQALFPTRAARQAHFDRCGGIDNRGPDCENVLIAPELAQDPLPYREVTGSKSYGSNLDGTEDGRETATTCAHQNFVHPDGTSGIDNQMYRLLGCHKWVNAGGEYAPSNIKQSAKEDIYDFRTNRTVMEIREVDDEQNDEHVEVVLYRGNDSLVVDAEGHAVPWQSQRIDADTPPQHLRGRIVQGELITEPTDISSSVASYFPHVLPVWIRGAQFRLRLSETGAEAVRTGYVDAASWWRWRRTVTGFGSVAGDSPPSLYEALHRLADGYKDPETGACTALSSATKLEFVRAHIRHPHPGDTP